MNQKQLSRWLSIITVIIAICTIIIYLIVIPGFGKDLSFSYPEFSSWYAPWLVFIEITSIPLYIAFFIFLTVSRDIGRDQAFTLNNAIRMKRISFLAGIDAIFFLIGNIVYLFIGMNHPGVLLLSFVICIAGAAIAIAAAVLSRLIHKAAGIQEENELTI